MNVFAVPLGMSPARLWFTVALGAALTFVVSPWVDAGLPKPDRSALDASSGKVTYLARERRGFKFRLSDSSKLFDYASTAGATSDVFEALSSSSTQTVNVLYSPLPRSALLQDDEFFSVWEVSIDGRMIRSVSESIASWNSDQAVRPWLFVFFGLCTAYLSGVALKTRPTGIQGHDA